MLLGENKLYLFQTGYFGLGNNLRRLRDRERRLEERRERFRERVRDFRERIRVMQENNHDNPYEPPTEDEITNLINEQRADIRNAPINSWAVVTNAVYMFFASLFPENIQEA